MRIKDFSIDNLYYEYAFSHTLDEHVNIIVGNNGTFKTTLLRLLHHAIAYEKNGQFFQSHLTRINFKDDLAMEYVDQDSYLDIRLEKLQSDYGYYLSDLVKELTDRINTNSSITKSELDKINERKNLFIRLVNECFAETGKRLTNDSTKLVLCAICYRSRNLMLIISFARPWQLKKVAADIGAIV